MVYAPSEEAYDGLYAELQSLNMPNVMTYFDSNWHSIRLEWTMFGCNRHSNYMNRTSNRVESLNQKLKLIIDKNSGLTKFFVDLNICMESISTEKNIKAVRLSMRRKRQRVLDVVQTQYSEYLTNFACEKLRLEYDKFENVELIDIVNNSGKTVYKEQMINVSVNNCECWFFKTMELPCRHIFKLLSDTSQDLFAADVCSRRWTRNYYNKSHPALNLGDTTLIRKSCTYIQKYKSPSEVDKYKKCAKITKNINDLISTKPNDVYNHYIILLRQIESELGSNQSITVQSKNQLIDITGANATSSNVISLYFIFYFI